MILKALKHRELNGIFGKILPVDIGEIREGDMRIYQTPIPGFIDEVSIDELAQKLLYTEAYTELEDYDLVNVEVLLDGELPSTRLEKQVLDDFQDFVECHWPNEKEKLEVIKCLSDFFLQDNSTIQG